MDTFAQLSTYLTDSENEVLGVCETEIKQGLESFTKTGMAFLAIRDNRLYREAFPTFEAYCQGRWGMGRRNVDHYIGAAQIGTQVPIQNLEFTQARELARLASPSTNGDKRKKEINYEAVIEVASEIDFSKATTKQVARAVDKKLSDLRREEKETPATPHVTDTARYRLLVSSIFDLPDHITEPVDAIITDPPYPEEYLPVYAELAQAAGKLLKPGGALVVMIGHSHLPKILELMTPHIKYLWTMAYLTPANTARVFSAKALVNWKPVLVFSNGSYTGDWYADVVNNSAPDKKYHEWGQGESGMAALLERFTSAGQTVLDPFCGGSATGAAALNLQRYYIGSDVDENAIEISAQRLEKIV